MQLESHIPASIHCQVTISLPAKRHSVGKNAILWGKTPFCGISLAGQWWLLLHVYWDITFSMAIQKVNKKVPSQAIRISYPSLKYTVRPPLACQRNVILWRFAGRPMVAHFYMFNGI